MFCQHHWGPGRPETNLDPEYAAKHAKNEYLIFLDSDVTVPKNLIDIIDQNYF